MDGASRIRQAGPARPGAVGRLQSAPAAVLWDMDGTLIDSEPYWMAAETEIARAHGLEWTTQDALQMVGKALPDAARILQRHGVDLPGEEIVDRLVLSVGARLGERVPWQAGARRLLTLVRQAGIPCALVTMSYRSLVDSLLGALPGGTFDVVVTGEDVVRGKPDPEPYLRAAELLGVPVTSCVAIEDSPPGIASAVASGAPTIGVRVVVPVSPRPGLSRVSSLDQIDLDLLGRVAGGQEVDLLGDDDVSDPASRLHPVS